MSPQLSTQKQDKFQEDGAATDQGREQHGHSISNVDPSSVLGRHRNSTPGEGAPGIGPLLLEGEELNREEAECTLLGAFLSPTATPVLGPPSHRGLENPKSTVAGVVT